jgi:hypothetical protein
MRVAARLRWGTRHPRPRKYAPRAPAAVVLLPAVFHPARPCGRGPGGNRAPASPRVQLRLIRRAADDGGRDGAGASARMPTLPALTRDIPSKEELERRAAVLTRSGAGPIERAPTIAARRSAGLRPDVAQNERAEHGVSGSVDIRMRRRCGALWRLESRTMCRRCAARVAVAVVDFGRPEPARQHDGMHRGAREACADLRDRGPRRAHDPARCRRAREAAPATDVPSSRRDPRGLSAGRRGRTGASRVPRAALATRLPGTEGFACGGPHPVWRYAYGAPSAPGRMAPPRCPPPWEQPQAMPAPGRSSRSRGRATCCLAELRPRPGGKSFKFVYISDCSAGPVRGRAESPAAACDGKHARRTVREPLSLLGSVRPQVLPPLLVLDATTRRPLLSIVCRSPH